jgi:hypothetical protein
MLAYWLGLLAIERLPAGYGALILLLVPTIGFVIMLFAVPLSIAGQGRPATAASVCCSPIEQGRDRHGGRLARPDKIGWRKTAAEHGRQLAQL